MKIVHVGLACGCRYSPGPGEEPIVGDWVLCGGHGITSVRSVMTRGAE